MKTLKLIGMVPLLVAASSFAQAQTQPPAQAPAPAQDDRAVPRGSGSTGSDAGSRHTGGSSSSSSSSGSTSSGDSNRGGSSASSGSDYSPQSDAAGRRPRPGTGSGSRDRYGADRNEYRNEYRSYPYSNYYYDPYSYSWGYPRSRYGLGGGYGYGYYDYGYSYGDYYGYYPQSYSRSYRYRSGNIAQVRTLVEPARTRVYVDGYYAGTADDFDGLLQRLNVSPGRHEISLRLEGYRSHTLSVYANRDQTLKLRFDMERGSGETRDTVGEPSPGRDRADDRDSRDDIENRDDRDNYRNDREVQMHRDSPRDRADRSHEVDSSRPAPLPSGTSPRGQLLLDIEPQDASVYVDGEFHGKASQLTRLELSPGRHRIEVVRPGYKTQETEVNTEGETKRVVIKLDRR